MQRSFKLASIAAAALLGAAVAVPASAKYEGPHEHYRSTAAFTRDVNGTPCGMNCSRAVHRHWAYHKVHHNWRATYPAR